MSVTKIWFRNYISDVLTTATVTLADPTGAYGIRMQNSPNTVLVASGTAVPEISTGLFEYGTAASPISDISGYDSSEPYEYYFKIVQSAGDVDYLHGVIAADTGYPIFSDAYGEVQTDVDNLVGSTQAKRLINEALRIVANDRPWDWVVGDSAYTLTLASGVETYTLPISVQHIIGAYSSDLNVSEYLIVPHTMFSELYFNNRQSGTPRKLYLLGDNVVMPDPVPDSDADGQTISVLYKKNFNLSADSDNFPCNRDFVDCIKTRAKYAACKLKGKDDMAKYFLESYVEMLTNLRVSQMNSEIYVPGEPGYRL